MHDYTASSLTCLAVFSFKPIRTLAQVSVISSYIASSSILAWQAGTGINCQLNKNVIYSRGGYTVPLAGGS